VEIFEQLGRVNLLVKADKITALGDAETADALMTSADWGWGERRQDRLGVSEISETHISMMNRLNDESTP
jgi:hypothetical protein